MSLLGGMWKFDGNQVEAKSLIALGSPFITHRPDYIRTHVDCEVGMLFQSLHTTQESRLDIQPFVSRLGNVVTFDGRLDNREDLARLLGYGVSNSKFSDVALAAAAFDEWGIGCFARLLGDWAIAVWSRKEKLLLLARDFLGIRPLFYRVDHHETVWCSQLQALVNGAQKLTLSEEYVAGYLANLPPADLTPYQEISSVPPAGFVQIQNNKARSHSYWTFDPSTKTTYKTDAEYEEHFRSLFCQAVRRRLRADSPVLAGLSGGLDSSSIVCIADEIQKTTAICPRLDTFSFCDRDEPEEDDFFYFTHVENRRGRAGHHAELQCTGDSFPIARFSYTCVPGFGERQELKTAMSDILARGQYRVILSGIGGDEFMGQAFNPRIHLAELLQQFEIRGFAESLVAWSLATRIPSIFLLVDTLGLFLPAAIRSAVTSRRNDQPWINVKFAARHRPSMRGLQAAGGRWWWSPKARDNCQTYEMMTRQLTYFSSSSSEARYPFLDQDLLKFLWSVPATQIARPGEPRSLMRRALKNTLPQQIWCRRTKASAGRCITMTFRKHKERITETLRSPLTCRMGYLDLNGLKHTLTAITNGQIPFQIVQFVKAVALEFWLREAVERNLVSANI